MMTSQFRSADGSHVLEQDQHSILEDTKPFGDRSKDLWNLSDLD